MPGGDWGAWELIGNSCTGETDTEENVEAVVDVGEEDKEAEDNENEIDNSSKWEHESPNGPPTLKEAEAREAELTNSPLFEMVKASIASLDSKEVDKISPGLGSNPANVKRVESIMSSEQWDYLFAVRDPDYTYRRHKLFWVFNSLQ